MFGKVNQNKTGLFKQNSLILALVLHKFDILTSKISINNFPFDLIEPFC